MKRFGAGVRWTDRVLARRPDYDWRPPAWVPVVAVAIAAVVYSVVAWSARYPVIGLDEVIMVANSHVIAGEAGAWQLSGAGFMPGLALLLAPVWWFTDNAVVVYQVGIWITVGLALLAIWPLSAIAQRAGVSRRVGVVVSSVVVMAPARTLLSNYLLAESAMLVTTAALLVAAERLWSRRRDVDALLFGAATGAAVLTHGRGVATAVAAGLWALMLLRHDSRRGLIAGTSALLGSLAAYAMYRVVTGEALANDIRVNAVFDDLSGRDLGASLAGVVGQLWYATIAWPAVAVIGAIAVIRWRRTGGMMGFVLLAVPLALLLSAVQLNPRDGLVRIDLWFYGRYMDNWWTILAVLGLALLVRVKWAAMSAVVVGVSGVLGLGMLLVTVRSFRPGGRWVDMHVLGLSPWLNIEAYAEGEPQSWTYIVLTGLALTVLVLAIALMRVWVIPTLAILWMWLSIAQDDQGIDPGLGARNPAADHYSLGLIPPDATVGIDKNLDATANLIAFAAYPRHVVKVDPAAPPDGVDVVYLLFLHTTEPPPGVTLLEPTRSQRFEAWIYPGALADRLAASGDLGPPGATWSGTASEANGAVSTPS